MARSGPSPRRFAPARRRCSSATWSGSGTLPAPIFKSRSSPSSVMNHRSCGTRPAGRWVGSADARSIASLAKCLGDESKVVRRAAAEALRLIGNRLNGSRRPGETEAQVQLVAVLRDALRSPDDRTRRGATRRVRRPLPRTVAGAGAGRFPAGAARRSRSGRRDAGDQGVVAVVVLAGRSEPEESDRGPPDRRAGRAPASLGPPQPDRGPLHHRRREHPLPRQQLDSVAGQRRRAGNAPPRPSTRRSTAWEPSTSPCSRQAIDSSARACFVRCRSSSSGRCSAGGSATTWSRCCSTTTWPTRSGRP